MSMYRLCEAFREAETMYTAEGWQEVKKMFELSQQHRHQQDLGTDNLDEDWPPETPDSRDEAYTSLFRLKL